jgi:hypothetical protein
VKKILFIVWFGISMVYAANPTHAMLYSAFIPGGGQIYNHAYVKAGIVIGIQATFWAAPCIRIPKFRISRINCG